MDDLGLGIQRDSEGFEHKESNGVFEFLATVVGVAAIKGFEGFLVEGIDYLRFCVGVGFTNAQVDEGEVWTVLNCCEFGAFNFFKFIEGVVFAIIGTPDSFGK